MWRHWVVASLAALLTACGTLPSANADLQGLLPTPLLLVGELHDAPEHQALQRDTVRQLAARGELAAVVMEMVEQGRQTTGLAPDAGETQVREALDWSAARNAAGWPWEVYGPVVMAAVRAGVPVTGGNLPRAQMRTVMAEVALDDSLPAAALQQQRDAIREGHCQLLPESQVAPMTRIQLARDRAMAQTALAAMRPGRTVLLVAGNGHVRKDLGVPRHLPAGQAHRVVVALSQDAASALDAAQADRIWFTPARRPQDHCAEMRQQMTR
ncbi:ChaN family lipoprotein [Hydrogenophaga sp. RWCD_12]|uniref:ChaN family lipoprotein n=1 Tax=Hydrogenophaga sp. RWCD_12 TaxID=3391190 RepID=UPI003984A9DC